MPLALPIGCGSPSDCALLCACSVIVLRAAYKQVRAPGAGGEEPDDRQLPGEEPAAEGRHACANRYVLFSALSTAAPLDNRCSACGKSSCDDLFQLFATKYSATLSFKTSRRMLQARTASRCSPSTICWPTLCTMARRGRGPTAYTSTARCKCHSAAQLQLKMFQD